MVILDLFSYIIIHLFYSGYNTVWIANTEICLDPNNSVIKRLRCIFNISVTCDVLDDIFSGNLTLITNETHTAVAVQCDVGSSVNGSVSVTCGQDGSWMESIPKCGNY